MSWGKRPTAVLMRDEWFGHRDPTTRAKIGDRDEWTSWDFALATAYQTAETYTDKNGLKQWEKEDPAIDVAAIRKIDPFQEAVQRKTGGAKYKAAPGEYFIPDIGSRRSDKTVWTYLDWVTHETRKIRDGKIE